MSNRKSDWLRTWVLGVATAGLLWQSMPVIGQSVNSDASSQKQTVAKIIPVQASQQPRLLPVPGDTVPTTNSVLLVSQTDVPAGQKSEVQRQLEALYEQDGREMPDMNFNLQPVSPNTTPPQQPANTAPGTRPGQPGPLPTQKPVRATQGYNQYQPRTQATPYPPQSNAQPPRNVGPAIDAQKPPQALPRQNAVTGFFKKLTGNNNNNNKPLSTEAPIPPDFANQVPSVNTVPSVPPASFSNAAIPATQMAVRNTAPLPVMNPAARPVTQPKLTNATLNTTLNSPSGNVQIVAGVSSIPSELPKPTVPLPALSQQPLPLRTASVASSVPPLMTQPQTRTTAVKSLPQIEKRGSTTGEIAVDFPNPFPELNETEADIKISSSPRTSPVIAPRIVAVDSPKVGAVVRNAIEPAKEVEAQAEPVAPKSDEDPYAVEAKNFVEPSIIEDLQPSVDPTAPSLENPPALAPVPLDDEKSANEPKPIGKPLSVDTREFLPPINAQESHLEKMRRIRQRFGMKGLKGFCPVTLREERELIDARTEFHSVHRNQKFHFASAEARDKFELNPFRYVPAAYGADVVALSRDKDVVEGTLDFALWYKGRLYLFGSQANYDVFIAEPTQFATLEGIE